MTARPARPAAPAIGARRELRRGRLRSPAVVRITDSGTMAAAADPGAMMSRRVQSAQRDVAAATQRLTAALATSTTNAQEA